MTNRTERELYELQERRNAQIVNDSANASGALFAGIFVAAIAALGVAMLYATQQSSAPQQAQPQTQVQPPDVNVQVPQPQVQPPDVNIQVPQAPQPPQVQPPEVNINLPDAQPSTAPQGGAVQQPTAPSQDVPAQP